MPLLAGTPSRTSVVIGSAVTHRAATSEGIRWHMPLAEARKLGFIQDAGGETGTGGSESIPEDLLSNLGDRS